MALIRNVARSGRAMRRPQHPFQIRTRPYIITPMNIVPVLPGETMKNALLQARVVSDPIKNRLIGWWHEHYFFYVKHRDLTEREEFVNMMIDPDWTPANVDGVTDVATNYFNGRTGNIDWVQKCLERVVAEFFRDEGDAWNKAGTTFGTLPIAQISGTSWLHSLVSNTDLAPLYDVDVDANADDTITIGEIDAARAQYEFLRDNFAVEVTYEDFLRTYGVAVPKKEEEHRPELLRFMRQWTYPVSAIDPTDGSAASAVNWAVAERIDKDRFFKEPGFIFAVSVTRPKVYINRQKGTATSIMNDAYSWLPAIMNGDPRTSLKFMPDNTLIGDNTDAGGAWVDIKDLLLYGEQFVNIALNETDANFVSVPTVGLEQKFPTSGDVDNLFSAASPANQIRIDGMVSYTIATRQSDTSPGT